MPTITFLFENPPFLFMPNGIIGWLGWLGMLGLNVFLLKRWWNYNQPWTKSRKWVFAFLVILVPLTSFVIPAIQLPPTGEFPVSILPEGTCREPDNCIWRSSLVLGGRIITTCTCCCIGFFLRGNRIPMGNQQPIHAVGVILSPLLAGNDTPSTVPHDLLPST